MPDVKIEKLPKSALKLTIMVSPEEMRPYLEDAAKQISEEVKIPGFRPGKASYDVVKQNVGEMKIYEAAMEPVVRKTFIEAVLSEKIETVGSPSIDISKLAPGNEMVYTAEVALMPKVKTMADYKKISVKANKTEAADKDLENAMKDLQRMQTKEVRKKSDSSAAKDDKVVVDMQMKKEGVPIEGGQGIGHAIFLNEDYYIPGLSDQLVGMKENEEKKFQLEFPKDHYQKHLSGAKIDFEVKLKEIYELIHPELDDEFAKSLGQKDFSTMKNLIKENIEREKETEEKFRQEKEMLEKIAEKTEFDEIPDLLVNEEIDKMVHELEHGVVEQGMDFSQYLKQIKKTIDELKLEFTPQAIMRIKVALVVKQVAGDEKIEVSDKELDDELDALAAGQESEEIKKRIYSPEYREYSQTMLRNRKVIDLLRQAIVKEAK